MRNTSTYLGYYTGITTQKNHQLDLHYSNFMNCTLILFVIKYKLFTVFRHLHINIIYPNIDNDLAIIINNTLK